MARLWSFLCSLKLAIVLASAATLVVMSGSVLMPGNPRLFAGMDAVPLGEWLAVAVPRAPGHTGWVPAAAILILLLGINTACCFVDWLLRFGSRWRKTGEYLIHLGFVLVLVGYVWGSTAGIRSEGNLVAVGGTLPVPGWTGHYLRLDSLEPRLDPRGRPMEITAELVLLRGDTPVAQKTVGANDPLLYQGVVAFPASFGYAGGLPYGILTINRDPGCGLAFAGAIALTAGVLLALFSFYAKRRRGDRPEIP